jgi:hypothetical protein
MRTYLLPLSLVALTLLTTVLATVPFFIQRSGISLARFNQIRNGMTGKEVAAILGGPPGSYSVDEPYEQTDANETVPLNRWPDHPHEYWFCYHTGIIVVVFNCEEGTVVDKAFCDFGTRPMPL